GFIVAAGRRFGYRLWGPEVRNHADVQGPESGARVHPLVAGGASESERADPVDVDQSGSAALVRTGGREEVPVAASRRAGTRGVADGESRRRAARDTKGLRRGTWRGRKRSAG